MKQPELDRWWGSGLWHSGKVKVMLERPQLEGFLKATSLRPLDCLVFSVCMKNMTKYWAGTCLTSEAVFTLLVGLLGQSCWSTQDAWWPRGSRRRRKDVGKTSSPHPQDSHLLSKLLTAQACLWADFGRAVQLKVLSGTRTEQLWHFAVQGGKAETEAQACRTQACLTDHIQPITCTCHWVIRLWGRNYPSLATEFMSVTLQS